MWLIYWLFFRRKLVLSKNAVLFLFSFFCHLFVYVFLGFQIHIVSRSLVIKKLRKVYPVQFLNEIVIKTIYSCAPRILMGITQQFCDSSRRTQNTNRYHENSVNSVWPYEYIFIHFYFVMLSGCLLFFSKCESICMCLVWYVVCIPHAKLSGWPTTNRENEIK